MPRDTSRVPWHQWWGLTSAQCNCQTAADPVPCRCFGQPKCERKHTHTQHDEAWGLLVFKLKVANCWATNNQLPCETDKNLKVGPGSDLCSLVHLHVSVFVEVVDDARDDDLQRVVNVTQRNDQTLVLHTVAHGEVHMRLTSYSITKCGNNHPAWRGQVPNATQHND